jgi:hypothetical protein
MLEGSGVEDDFRLVLLEQAGESHRITDAGEDGKERRSAGRFRERLLDVVEGALGGIDEDQAACAGSGDRFCQRRTDASSGTGNQDVSG